MGKALTIERQELASRETKSERAWNTTHALFISRGCFSGLGQNLGGDSMVIRQIRPEYILKGTGIKNQLPPFFQSIDISRSDFSVECS